jgi:hypothetical protein
MQVILEAFNLAVSERGGFALSAALLGGRWRTLRVDLGQLESDKISYLIPC